jgi:adenylosuccinate synthase
VTHKAVIGLGFGDEGKGAVVDYLCSLNPSSIVVRFNGGHQAGHTVVNENGRHVHSNFGSGTLRGKPTYWSRFCTVNPVSLLNERDTFPKKVKPTLYIEGKCPITTPYDIMANRWNKNNCSHGTCGVGFGETIKREENHCSLTFYDLFYPGVLKEKLRAIHEYYKWKIYLDTKEFVSACQELVKTKDVYLTDDKFLYFRSPTGYSFIFEGAQGLLLDQNFGFFPNVTRSNTGYANIFALLPRYVDDLYLVTRAYQTRHGNGYMSNEDLPHNIKEDPLETNQSNEWQGEFRRALLDVSLLEYGMGKDPHISDRYSLRKSLVITCLDHIRKDYRFTYKGEIVYCKNEKDFVGKVARLLKIETVYVSKSNDSRNIRKLIGEG